MSPKIKMTKAVFDALPEEASVKVYDAYCEKWVKYTIHIDQSNPKSPLRLGHEEIEIVPEEGEK